MPSENVLPVEWPEDYKSSCYIPSHSAFDHESLFASLRANPHWSGPAERPGVDLMLLSHTEIQDIAQVFVILFGVGQPKQQEQEGIYSLRYQGPEGLPQETIIVFQSHLDAERYASMLEVMMTHTPHVCSIGAEDLVDFCVERGYRCKMEQEGSVLVPPDFSVKVTDWERAKKLRSGSFAVLESEPVGVSEDSFSTSVSWMEPKHDSRDYDQGNLIEHQTMSKDQLDVIKSKLEALLPPERPELN